jgi:hypothetical protein
MRPPQFVAVLALLATQGAAYARPTHLAFCNMRRSCGPALPPWGKRGASCFALRRLHVSMRFRDNDGGAKPVESFEKESRRAVLKLTGVYGLSLIGTRVASLIRMQHHARKH